MEGWQKLLLAAGGAAGVAALLYYLLREEGEEKAVQQEKEEVEVKKRPGELTRNEVKEILQELVGMQQVMKTNMKALTAEMAKKDMSFDEIYEAVQKAQPADPLEKRGLKPDDLDRVLQSHGSDPEVMQAVSKLMGAEPPSSATAPSKRSKEMTVDLIVEIHSFMLEELQVFAKTFMSMGNNSSYDLKTVGIVSQAMLDSKVSAKFNVSSEDMEGAILANKEKLVQNMKFMQVHMEMQQVMHQFLGAAM